MTDAELDVLIGRAPDPPPAGEHVDDALLLQYVRRTLDKDQSAEIQRHLTTCADCRLLAEGLALERNPALNEAAKRAIGRRTVPRQIFGAIAAIAAAILLFIVVPRGTRDAAIPSFRVEGPFGGIKSARHSTEAGREFAADSALEIILRPEFPAPEVDLRAMVALDRGGPVETRVGRYERTESGALIYRARAGDLFGAHRGEHTLILELTCDGEDIGTFSVELSYLGEVNP